MHLTKQSINYLKSLKEEYTRKEKIADLYFIKNTLEIIEADKRFKSKIECIITDDSRINPAEENKGKIYINPWKMYEFANANMEYYKNIFPESCDIELKNFVILCCLFHECTHSWHDTYLDPYPEINRLYKIVQRKCEKRRNINIYNKYGDYFFFEREANIAAYRTLVNVYKGDSLERLAKTCYMLFLDYLYGKKSPVERTLNVLKIKNAFDFSGIPLLHSLEVGLPLAEEVLKQINDILVEEAKGTLTFAAAIKRIKKMDIIKR